MSERDSGGEGRIRRARTVSETRYADRRAADGRASWPAAASGGSVTPVEIPGPSPEALVRLLLLRLLLRSLGVRGLDRRHVRERVLRGRPVERRRLVDDRLEAVRRVLVASLLLGLEERMVL